MDLLLPPIELEKIPDATRTWLLAKAAQKGCDPLEVIRIELDAAAAQDGFKPEQLTGQIRQLEADLKANKGAQGGEEGGR